MQLLGELCAREREIKVKCEPFNDATGTTFHGPKPHLDTFEAVDFLTMEAEYGVGHMSGKQNEEVLSVFLLG